MNQTGTDRTEFVVQAQPTNENIGFEFSMSLGPHRGSHIRPPNWS